jgi:hypothetical protein
MSTPARHGQPWLEEEIQKLLQAVKRKDTTQQIAIAHERTSGSIRAKLKGLAADYYFNDNRPISEIMKFTGLDAETITDAIAKRQWEMDQKEKKQLVKPTCASINKSEVKEETVASVMIEIRDMMRELLEIIKEKKSEGPEV